VVSFERMSTDRGAGRVRKVVKGRALWWPTEAGGAEEKVVERWRSAS
jgi:hypothetical protein